MHCHRQVVGVVGMNGGQEGQVARNPSSGSDAPTCPCPSAFGVELLDGRDGAAGAKGSRGRASHWGWGMKIPVAEDLIG